MPWNNKKKKNLTKVDNYSIIKKLEKEKKLNKHTLNDINNISLEELIAVKLELSTRYLCGKFYGMPLWKITRHTVTDALLKTGLSIAKTKKEAARFLGVDYMDFNRYIKKYGTISYFENGGETVSTKEE
jgi:transcriptional regulator with GAF, ATPase, and Fis domain|tara:strand:+ start:189 stop:575 length:387 start_codon:yes stop_codon:yes gene_type:complete